MDPVATSGLNAIATSPLWPIALSSQHDPLGLSQTEHDPLNLPHSQHQPVGTAITTCNPAHVTYSQYGPMALYRNREAHDGPEPAALKQHRPLDPPDSHHEPLDLPHPKPEPLDLPHPQHMTYLTPQMGT